MNISSDADSTSAFPDPHRDAGNTSQTRRSEMGAAIPPALPLAENTDNTPIILPPSDTSGLQPNRPAEGETERRIYLPWPDGWEAHVKQGWDKDYCFTKNPGQDYFHLILSGEVYLQHGTEKYCLNCALRHGVATTNRLHWQVHPRKKDSMPL